MKRAGWIATVWVSLCVVGAGCNWEKSAPAHRATTRGITREPVQSTTTKISSTSTAPASTRAARARERARAHHVTDAKSTLSFLASDELEGRGIGTRGLDRAADYIADQLKAAGLEPAPGRQDFFQRFEMTASTEIGKKTSLASGDRTFTVRKDFVPLTFSAEKAFDGPVVFAGYGISSAEKYKYDDYANLDVKGKVVLAMRFEPRNNKGKSRFTTGGDWSTEAHFSTKAKVAQDHGAVAILFVTPPGGENKEAESLMPFSRVMGGGGKIPQLQIRQSLADELLKKGGAPDLKTLAEKIDQAQNPASFALADVTVKGNVDIERKVAQVRNVVGYLPGAKTDEFIVIGAHYDHLGLGGVSSLAPTTRAIHNGADDNASGTTALIQIAERLASGPQLPRGVLFVAFTGEEEGIIGSEHFIKNPPIPLKQITAMLNLDMVGRLKTNVLDIGGSGTAASFEEILKRVDADSPLTWKDIGKGGLGPSDHMAFGQKKIPVMFFFTGLHADYHRPTDDADKINYAGLDQVVDFVTKVAQQVAAMPRQEYVTKFDTQSMKVGTPSASRVTLGVIPDYSSMGGDSETPGVKIGGTSPDSPAAKAGLKEGDILLQFGDTKLDNLYDLSEALSKASPGDKVHLKYQRGNENLETDVTLAARK